VRATQDRLQADDNPPAEAARIFQTGGGVGYSFSELRPAGDRVGNGGVASGPVSFMRVFDAACGEVRQGGRRRGAQMGVLRVDHPDVGRFCVEKRREGALANFNVSVGITDDFYAAVEAGDRYPLINPRTGDQHAVTERTVEFYTAAYEDTSPTVVAENFWRDHADDIAGTEAYRGETDLAVGEPMMLPAGFVWELLVDGTWHNGEPGLFMLDATNADHSFDVNRRPDHYIAATNPCGEQGLENFEACTLGHVNLSLMVADDATPWPDFREEIRDDLASVVQEFLQQALDWNRLGRVVRDGTRFLDDVVTASQFPLSEIAATVGQLRKIGLGIMGFADLLLQLGVRYGSEPSFEVARQVMTYVNTESTMASHELAAERGAFPTWSESKYATPIDYPEWFERHTGRRAANWPDGFELRNHSTTTIAPTGTTSVIADASGGCEPLFNVVYFRNAAEDVRGEDAFVEFDDYFLRVLTANGLDADAVAEEALELLQAGEFTGPKSLSIPDEIAKTFVTAADVTPTDHVRMQAAFQEHVDAAISKTINFPADATRESVDEAFCLAVDLGCKGLTAYRDQSRRVQVLTTRPDELVQSGGRPEEARCCPL
jgi:adenosylcobalamin-dependent ribonucleoside-diphosphate reductase